MLEICVKYWVAVRATPPNFYLYSSREELGIGVTVTSLFTEAVVEEGNKLFTIVTSCSIIVEEYITSKCFLP